MAIVQRKMYIVSSYKGNYVGRSLDPEIRVGEYVPTIRHIFPKLKNQLMVQSGLWICCKIGKIQDWFPVIVEDSIDDRGTRIKTPLPH